MCFDPELRIRLLQSRTITNIQYGAEAATVYLGVNGIDSFGGKHQARSINVGGGKAQFPAETISFYDAPGERISAPQHLAGAIELAGDDGFSYASAADGFAIQHHCGQAVNREIPFSAQVLQQGHVATPAVAKYKIRSN